MDNAFSTIVQHSEIETKIQTPLWNCGCLQSHKISFEELPLMGHFNLRMAPLSPDRKVAERLLGLLLPDKPLTSMAGNDARAHWIGPDDWLILKPFEKSRGLEANFRHMMRGYYSITDVSAGQTVIRLSGSCARSVLQKSTTVDVHTDAFPVGKVVSTSFAKSVSIIFRADTDIYELIVRSSFACYVWEWLVDATAEYRS